MLLEGLPYLEETERGEEMNELNYASIEASKKLSEAGIVLETDAVWYEDYTTSRPRWIILYRGVLNTTEKTLPAPSMAELWRELPDEVLDGGAVLAMSRIEGITYVGYNTYDEAIVLFKNINPADALVELLVWLEKEKLRETEAVKKDPVIDKNSAAYMDN